MSPVTLRLYPPGPPHLPSHTHIHTYMHTSLAQGWFTLEPTASGKSSLRLRTYIEPYQAHQVERHYSSFFFASPVPCVEVPNATQFCRSAALYACRLYERRNNACINRAACKGIYCLFVSLLRAHTFGHFGTAPCSKNNQGR